MKRFLCVVAAAGAVCTARLASAAEGDVATGLGVSLPFASADYEGSAFLDLEFEYGLSESVQLGAEFGTAFDANELSPRLVRLTPLIGVELDVVEWVPYAASGPTLLLLLGTDPRVAFGADLVLGLDYLISRSLALGVQYQLTATVVGDGLLLHRAGLRAMYRWGW